MSITGVPGLDKVLGNSTFPPKGAIGYRLLIRGLPGTGKTTLGLHLFNRKLQSGDDEREPAGRLLYFQEALPPLDYIGGRFGLSFKGYDLTNERWTSEEIDAIAEGKPSSLDAWLDGHAGGDCLFLDGLSLLKSVEPIRVHRFLINLMAIVQREGLLTIITGEEEVVPSDHFFEHLADGIINLSVDPGPHRHRFLEITKLRYIDYARGRHAFQMYETSKDGRSTLEVFPSPACHFLRIEQADAEIGNLRLSSQREDLAIPSGIGKLEGILNGDWKEGDVLRPGDAFLVTAEPGTAKTAMGLSFLAPINPGLSFWVSFGVDSLDRVLSHHAGTAKHDRHRRFRERIAKNRQLTQIVRPSIAMHPDYVVSKLVGRLEEEREKQRSRSGNASDWEPLPPIRVVIDGLASVAAEFGSSDKSSEYARWLARILSRYHAVTFLFVDLPSSFQPIGEIPMELEPEVDFVGHLRWFEVNNEITMSFLVSKSKYPNFRLSKPHYVVQGGQSEDDSLVSLEDRGWQYISMLSGRAEAIHEAKVFLKFFDQNYSTRAIHAKVLDDFRDRYSNDQVFAHVVRSSPSPKHWSFRGYAGAGHSNTKIVCLRQHVLQVLDKDGVLLQFPPDESRKYLQQIDTNRPAKEYIKAGSYSLWGIANGRSNVPAEQVNTLPLFADIGVLVAQIDKDQLRAKAETELPFGWVNHEHFWVPQKVPKTWSEMFEINNALNANRGKWPLKLRVVPSDPKTEPYDASVNYIAPWIQNVFAMPSLTSDASGFIAFFLELLMEHSRKAPKDLKRYLLQDDGLSALIDDRECDGFAGTVDLLRKLVEEKVSRNPLERIHYHNAFFSRRWISKVDQFPADDPELPLIEKYRHRPGDPAFNATDLKMRLSFSVHPLPSSSKEQNPPIGFSFLEFYSVGVIRGALAPETAWMFISELASPRTDTKRFEERRGLPVLRENWSAAPENPQRLHDQGVLDQILRGERFFCTFWIPNYFQIDDQLGNLMRRIFIKKESGEWLENVENLRKDFLEVLNSKSN